MERLAHAACWSLALTLGLCPFDTDVWAIEALGRHWTPLELAMMTSCALAAPLWLQTTAQERRSARPTLAFMAAVVLSAGLGEGAWTGAGRLLLYGALLLSAAAITRAHPRVRHLASVAWLTALSVSGLLGVFELSSPNFEPLELFLSTFRPKAIMVDGARRLTSTFSHANLAGLSFAMALPIALCQRGLIWRGASALAGLALLGTGSRGALLAAVVGLWLIRRRARSRAWVPVLVGAVVALTLWPMSRHRLGLGADAPGYAAELTVSSDASTAQLTNRGWLRWRHQGTDPVVLIVTPGDGGASQRLPLPRDVASGDTLALPISDAKLGDGAWLQLAQRGLRRFGPAVWTGDAKRRPALTTPSAPTAARRSDLWPIALELWSERPLLGWGPDQFRSQWPKRAPDLHPDERMHANQLLLEVVADLGLLGLLTLLWALWSALRTGRLGALQVSCVVWLVFGLLDCPLYFHGVSAPFWVLAGIVSVEIDESTQTTPARSDTPP